VDDHRPAWATAAVRQRRRDGRKRLRVGLVRGERAVKERLTIAETEPLMRRR